MNKIQWNKGREEGREGINKERGRKAKSENVWNEFGSGLAGSKTGFEHRIGTISARVEQRGWSLTAAGGSEGFNIIAQ